MKGLANVIIKDKLHALLCKINLWIDKSKVRNLLLFCIPCSANSC